MTGTEVVIDLGVLRAGDEPTPVPASPGWQRRWRGPRFALRHWVFVAVLAVLTGATLGGATTMAGAPVELFAAPIGHRGTYAVGDGLLYTLRVGNDGAGLAAYGLGDGARRWETPVQVGADPRDQASLAELGDVLVVMVGRDHRSDMRTLVFDAGTGRPLWTHPGYVLSGPGTGPLIVSQPLPCPVGECFSAPDSVGLAQELIAMDRRTGAERWRLRIDEHTGYATPDPYAPSARMVVTAPDGLITVHDLATGGITGTLRASAAGSTPPRFAQFIGDRLLVRTGDELTAYDGATLGREWTIRVGTFRGLLNCGGPLLCVLTEEGTQGIDAATGRQRWWLPGLMALGEFDGRHLVGYPLNGERSSLNTELIDAGSGERLFPLGQWEPVGYLPGPSRGVVARWDRTRSTVWLGMLRPEAGGVWPLGTRVSRVWEMCTATRSGPVLLVCPSIDQTVRVLRPPD
jgi:hypothetical protein